jgi:hypothetical protein
MPSKQAGSIVSAHECDMGGAAPLRREPAALE